MMAAHKGEKQEKAPAHYSDNWLLRFYFTEVEPKLDRKLVWTDLREKGGRLEDAKCSGCGRTETYTYTDRSVLWCSHKNSCNRRETILEKLAGCPKPSGIKLLEAIQEAARLACVLFPKKEATPEEREQARKWGQRKDCLDAAAQWCEDQLWKDNPASVAARDYLHSRGFKNESIKELGLGLFGKTTDLKKALEAQKLNLAVAGEAALFMGNLEGYVIFPWSDEHGNILTLYGRWPEKELPLRKDHPGRWKAEEAEKAIPKTYALPGENTKADPLYLDRAKRARTKDIVCVEGVIDAAIAQVYGDPRVVAYVAGTLAGKQVEALVRYQPASITLCPDPDAGGDDGVLSSIKRLSEAGVRIYVAPRLPDGKDPDEYILAYGIDAWKAFLDEAIPSSVFLTQLALKDISRALPAKRKEEALRQIVEILSTLDGDGSALDRAAIIKLAVEKLGYSKTEINSEISKRRQNHRQSKDKIPGLKEVHRAPHIEAGDSWRSRLVWTETQHGAYLTKNTANAATILAHHPAWQGVLAFDDFAQQIVALKTPPSHGEVFKPPQFPHRWTDRDDILAGIWLQRGEPALDVPKSQVLDAVLTVASANRIHPVRQYLDALEWDKKPRIQEWLVRYAQAEVISGSSEYLREIGAKWLISAVARIYQPGVKVDTILILEGSQGLRKSTALKILGGDWYTDELADVGSKDAAMQLQGAWIIELAELDALSKSESSKIKAFFTRTTERYVPKWGKHAISVPRQCVFAGSVNPDTYFKDETGNRRFWPVRCTNTIDTEGLSLDRDQIWAEAVALYKRGISWHLDPNMEVHARSEQDARYRADAWEAIIESHIGGFDRVSVQQILGQALNLQKSDWGQIEQNRVAACLKRLGWERKKVRLKAGDAHQLGISGDKAGLAWVYVPAPPKREPGEEG